MRRQTEELGQNNIIEKLSCFAKKNGIKQINPAGICNTLTMLYILARENEFPAEYLLELDEMVERVGLPTQPKMFNPPSREWLLYTKYIHLAIFFQSEQPKFLSKSLSRVLRNQYALNMLLSETKSEDKFTDDIELKQSTSMEAATISKINLDKNGLITLIKLIAQPKMRIKINPAGNQDNNRTIAMEFTGTDYIFFSSQFTDFVTKFNNINALAEEIIKTMSLGNFFSIEVEIFSRLPIPAFDRIAFINQMMLERKLVNKASHSK